MSYFKGTLLVKCPPTIEDTDPYPEYQAHAPDQFASEDKRVLYTGVPNMRLSFSAVLNNGLLHLPLPVSPFTNGLHVPPEDYEALGLSVETLSSTEAKCTIWTDIYVLNTSLVLWFPGTSAGLDVPYQSIVLHALNRVSQDEFSMYMQLQRGGDVFGASNDRDEPVELFFKAPAQLDTNCKNPLLPQINTREHVMLQIFNAVGNCSARHADPESDTEEQEAFGDVPVFEESEGAVLNSQGVADDLGDGSLMDESSFEAGMMLDARDTGRGVVRLRDEEEEDETSKIRRFN